MDLSELHARLELIRQSLPETDRLLLKARLEGLASAFPFNEYEYCLMFYMNRGVINFAEYESLRREYVDSNQHLNLFELSPRVFGEIWGHDHILDLDPRFRRASNEVDPRYSGDYDLWIEGTRVEIKAARAINTRQRGSLVSKALRLNSTAPFWMNYQQMKLDVADVFILIGVWVDEIRYWVLSNQEVRSNPFISHQHRGGVEFQIGITHRNIRQFDAFLVAPTEVADVAIQKGQARQDT
jgi:hypothetical protein